MPGDEDEVQVLEQEPAAEGLCSHLWRSSSLRVCRRVAAKSICTEPRLRIARS